MLDTKRIALLRVAKSRLKLSDDDFRALVWRFGQGCPGMDPEHPSSKCLTLDAFDALMDHFKHLGFLSDARRRSGALRAGMATTPQIELIERLWVQYSGRGADPQGLRRWLERYFHVSHSRFLTMATARKAITALTAMNKRRQREGAIALSAASPNAVS